MPTPSKQRELTISDLLRPHAKQLVLAFFAVLGETANDLAEPWPLKVVLDTVTKSKERAAAGVEVRIIGKLKRQSPRLAVRKLVQMRLHTRTILRDGERAFIGSQSLRELELEKRREVGIIMRDRKAVHLLRKVFAEDWSLAEGYGLVRATAPSAPVTRIAKRVAKAVAAELPPVSKVLEVVVKEAGPDFDLNPTQVEETVKRAVKEAVKQAVKDVVETVANGDKR